MTTEERIAARMEKARQAMAAARDELARIDGNREEYAERIEDNAIGELDAEIYRLRWTIRRSAIYGEYMRLFAEYSQLFAGLESVCADRLQESVKDLMDVNRLYRNIALSQQKRIAELEAELIMLRRGEEDDDNSDGERKA